MARQTEWWVVGLDKDPTPGNGSVVAGLIARMTTLADEADRARNGVVGLLRDKALDSWMGASGDAFREACEPLPDQLSKVRTSYDDCAAALKTYEAALSKAVQRADNACAEALRVYHTFPASLPPPAGASDAEYHHWVAGLEPPPLLTPNNNLFSPTPSPTLTPSPSPTYSPNYSPKNNLFYPGTTPAPVWTARQQQMVNARAEVLAAVADNVAAAQACQRAIDDARRPAATIGASTPGGSGSGGSGNLGTTFDERFKNAGGDVSKLVLDPAAGVDVETVDLPVQGTPPDEVARWWAGLDAASRSRYIHDHAADIAGLNGIPDADRAAADAILHPPKVAHPRPHPHPQGGDQRPDGGGHPRHRPTGGHDGTRPAPPQPGHDHKVDDRDPRPGHGKDPDPGKDRPGGPLHGGHPPQHGGHPPQHGGHPIHDPGPGGDGDRPGGPQHGGHPPQHGGHPPQRGGHPVHGGDPAHDPDPRHDGDHPGPGPDRDHDPRPGHEPMPGRHQGPVWPDDGDRHGDHRGGGWITTPPVTAADHHDGAWFDPSHRAVPVDTAFQHMPGPIHPVDAGQSPAGHVSAGHIPAGHVPGGHHTPLHHGAVLHDAAVGHLSATHHPSAHLGYDMVNAPSAGAWAPGLEATPTTGPWAPGLDATPTTGAWAPGLDATPATGAWAPGLDAAEPVGHWDTASAAGGWGPGLDGAPVQDPATSQIHQVPFQEATDREGQHSGAARRSYI